MADDSRLGTLIRQLQGTVQGLVSSRVRGDEENLRVIRGVVNGATIEEGSGFTVTVNGGGDVTVNFTVAFSDVPAVRATALHASAFRHAQLHSVTASAARVLTLDSGFNFTATRFHFTAMGPA